MQTFSVRFPGIWLNIVCNNIIKRKIWHSTFRRFNHFVEAAVDVKTEFGWRVVWGGRVIGGKFSIYSPSPEALKENYFSENGRCMYVSTTHVCIYAWYKRDSKELFAIPILLFLFVCMLFEILEHYWAEPLAQTSDCEGTFVFQISFPDFFCRIQSKRRKANPTYRVSHNPCHMRCFNMNLIRHGIWNAM